MPGPILFPLIKYKQSPLSMIGMTPQPRSYLRVYGVTKDSTGTPVTGVTVNLYRTSDNVLIDTTISNGNGSYEFRSGSPCITYYVVAYKAGAPDIAGTTVNTLVAS